MRYFGEHKKGTLTLGWSIDNRIGYTACHGGQKRFNLPDGSQKVISVFGLSGSGKSTITLSDHNGKMNTTVLHDDAFIINNGNGFKVKEGTEIECSEKINELQNLDVELPDITFDIEDFGNIELTMEVFNIITPFLKNE
jgi:ATP-dependent phosphoenolpyruvate carboxykinase